jgi:hypothetical protein
MSLELYRKPPELVPIVARGPSPAFGAEEALGGGGSVPREEAKKGNLGIRGRSLGTRAAQTGRAGGIWGLLAGARPWRRRSVLPCWHQGAAARRRSEARMACAAREPGEVGPTDGGW